MSSNQASRSGRVEATNAVIVFVDLCGSTPLYERSGDRSALRMISGALDDMERIVHHHGGRVIRSKGDDLLCIFAGPVDALDAATDILASFMNIDTAVRMGMHFGQVIEARGDIFGDAVNVAARMLGLAKPREMLCTEALAKLLPEERRNRLTALGKRPVKGKGQSIPIYSLVQADGASTNMVPVDAVTEKALGMQAETLAVLQQSDRRWTCGPGQPDLHIGRSGECDIRLRDGSVSREHATIRVAPGQISLIDHSMAGSWICVAGEPIVPLHRRSMALTGEGIICFGSPPTAHNEPPRLSYSITGVNPVNAPRSPSVLFPREQVQSRALRRTPVKPFAVHVTRDGDSTDLVASVQDLSLHGACLLANRRLGMLSDGISVRLDAGGPHVRCVLRYTYETGAYAWCHGVMFDSLQQEALGAVERLLTEQAKSP